MDLDRRRHDGRGMTGPAALRRAPGLLVCGCFAVLLAVVAGAGCAGGAARRPAATSAAGEAVGLTAFLDLPAEARVERRRLAADRRDDARADRRVATRLEGLTAACDLAPDDADLWLELAGMQRWYGDYLAAESSLDNAGEVARTVVTQENRRRDILVRAAVARAWLHYDLAQWQQGIQWARGALKLAPGNSHVLRVLGLLQACAGNRSRAESLAAEIRRAEDYSTAPRWILALTERSYGRDRETMNHFYTLRPDRDHTAECYRDMGDQAERFGDWGQANAWYDESAAALRAEHRLDLVRIEHRRLEEGADTPQYAVWLTPDHRYVTGSLSAYVGLAADAWDGAAPGAQREFWAQAVVNAAGVYLRHHPRSIAAQRARGLVFAGTGMDAHAWSDLNRVADRLASQGQVDARVEAELGRLAMRTDDLKTARARLEASLEAGESAAAWRDLGLVLVRQGVKGEALAALSRAVELDPDDPTAWYNRGLLHLHEGRRDQAADDLARAAALAPDNQEVARLLQQLRRAGGPAKQPPEEGDTP